MHVLQSKYGPMEIWTHDYLDFNNCMCKERIFDKLKLTCEDETVNTLGTASINFLDKIVTYGKIIVFLTPFY